MNSSPLDFRSLLAAAGYISDERLALALNLAVRLERPLLLEGNAGVGKTFVAQALAEVLDRPLIRLQCYEGLDVNHAIYEWNYQRQMLAVARAAHTAGDRDDDRDLFSEAFLIRRPLLEAISQESPPVLLIDELDRADEEFEAFLLEMLAEYQITIPEIGKVSATSKPLTIITSNGVRDLSDALRRRCLFHHIDFPDPATELRIIQARVPDCSVRLAQTVASFVAALRQEDLEKTPGIAETLDWVAALIGLGVEDIHSDLRAVHASLLCVLKTEADQALVDLPRFERLAAQAIP
ncbi:MAG: MoxR family ATPase [Pseudomonadota bacterium]